MDRVLGEKYASNSDCNMAVPKKIPKVVRSNEQDFGINSSTGKSLFSK